MKIQAHADFPPTPFISAIPRARIPPKAPASVAAEKNKAIRKPHSVKGVSCYDHEVPSLPRSKKIQPAQYYSQ